MLELKKVKKKLKKVKKRLDILNQLFYYIYITN